MVDVGCGTGTLVIAAAQAEPKIVVVGIDPAKEMVGRAEQKAAAAGVEARFEVGVIEQLDIESGSVDATRHRSINIATSPICTTATRTCDCAATRSTQQDEATRPQNT